jgi:AcrR family transcriptional regulator
LFRKEVTVADKTADRRIQKTLHLLQTALADLITEKAYDDITIQEILDRANVGRSTFYAHFENKDQLFRSILTRLNDRFEEGIRNFTGEPISFEANSAHMPLRVIQFVEQNHHLFRAMLGKSGQGSRHNPLEAYLFPVTQAHFRAMLQLKHGDPIQIELAAHYYASAFIGARAWWLENDRVYSAVTFAHMINRLTLPGMKAVFGD